MLAAGSRRFPSPRARFAVTVAALCACLAAAACGGATSKEATASNYADTAQAAYELAMDDFRDEDCMGAEPQFRDVRRKFAYSRFAALAELRLADCGFISGRYTEAISSYRAFVRNRPSHAEVPYARFKVAEAYYEQIPSDLLFLVPGEEKDQSPTRDALRELRRFILDYSEDPRVNRANKMVKAAMTELGKHEFYVAKFYLHRDLYPAAIARLETLIASYPGSSLEPEALRMLGESFLEIGNKARAKQVYQRLLQDYPESSDAKTVRPELKKLGG